MKKIKQIILVIIALVMLFGLTGCLNKNIRNLSDSEIIKQIQAKMKEEMDKIDFEVNFEDYEFKVNTGVEIQSNFGKVTIKDKRYNYDPIEIYDGNFEKIQIEKIGVNPIIFVAHGYQNYINTKVLTNKELTNNFEGIVKNYKVEFEPLNSRTVYRNGEYPGTVGSYEELSKYNNLVSGYYYTYSEMSFEDFVKIFKGQMNSIFDYNLFQRKSNFIARIVISTNEKIDLVNYFDKETLLIVQK